MITQLEDNLLDALSDAVGDVFPDLIIFHSNKNIPEPTGTYLVIRNVLLNPTASPYDVNGIRFNSTTGKYENRVLQDYEWYVQLRGIGDNSGDVVTEVIMALSQPSVREYFESRGLSYSKCNSPRRSPSQREDGWVDAYTLDVFFLVTLENYRPIPIIDNVLFDDLSYPTTTITLDTITTQSVVNAITNKTALQITGTTNGSIVRATYEGKVYQGVVQNGGTYYVNIPWQDLVLYAEVPVYVEAIKFSQSGNSNIVSVLGGYQGLYHPVWHFDGGLISSQANYAFTERLADDYLYSSVHLLEHFDNSITSGITEQSPPDILFGSVHLLDHFDGSTLFSEIAV